jgi:hypothetical protein
MRSLAPNADSGTMIGLLITFSPAAVNGATTAAIAPVIVVAMNFLLVVFPVIMSRIYINYTVFYFEKSLYFHNLYGKKQTDTIKTKKFKISSAKIRN